MDLFLLIAKVKELTVAVKTKDWGTIASVAGEILIALGKLFKTPPTVGVTEQQEKELQQALGELSSVVEVGADVDGIEPGTIIMVIQVIKTLIDLWRKRK